MKRPTSRQIVDKVSGFYDVPIGDIEGPTRFRRVNHVRQVAMYLMRELTKYSLNEIGIRVGFRDHTTVLHGIRTIASRRVQDSDLSAQLDMLAKDLSSRAALGIEYPAVAP